MKSKTRCLRRLRSSALSLLELLAVLTILAIIAMVVIPHISVSSETARTKANAQNLAEINSAVERWHVETGSWPKTDLSDINADARYFPDGLPTNPLTDQPYTLDPSTHRAK